MSHPIRKAKIHTFERRDSNEGGVNWIARFYPYSTYPVYFPAADEAEAIEKAEAFRSDAIAKHEQACINRQNARVKAMAARKNKKATSS